VTFVFLLPIWRIKIYIGRCLERESTFIVGSDRGSTKKPSGSNRSTVPTILVALKLVYFYLLHFRRPLATMFLGP